MKPGTIWKHPHFDTTYILIKIRNDDFFSLCIKGNSFHPLETTFWFTPKGANIEILANNITKLEKLIYGVDKYL